MNLTAAQLTENVVDEILFDGVSNDDRKTVSENFIYRMKMIRLPAPKIFA